MKAEISIAIIQMTSTDSPDQNFKTIYNLLDSISDPIDWAFFPENSMYMKIDENSPKIAFDLNEKYFVELQDLCKRKQFPVLLGSVPVKKPMGVFNSTVVVNAINSVAVYDKIHLFDVDVEGEVVSRESDNFVAGNETIVLSKDGWRLGLSICYDLRFSELYSQYVKDEVDVLLVPSAFLPTTGEAHWQVLLRARAIENQCYVVAPAQVGTHKGTSQTGTNQKTRHTYGHSMVVDPWGRILCDMGQEETPRLEIVNLSKEEIKKVKTQIPMKQHRKILWDKPQKGESR